MNNCFGIKYLVYSLQNSTSILHIFQKRQGFSRSLTYIFNNTSILIFNSENIAVDWHGDGGLRVWITQDEHLHI